MNFLQIIEKQNYQIEVNEVLECNYYANKFGLTLSEVDAKQLVTSKKNILKEHERLEFDTGIIEKIIFAFCDSQFICTDNYVKTINELIEIFYRYKNETMDMISDDELIKTMKEAFEGKCEGAIEFLDDTCLEAFARKVRGYNFEIGRNDKYE